MVVAHRLDPVWRNEPQQHAGAGEVRARSGAAPFLHLVEQLPLGAGGGARPGALGDRRAARDVVGLVRARSRWAAPHVAGEFGAPLLGVPPPPDAPRLPP